MRLIDADASDLQRELFSFTRYTGIDEMPYENACMALDIAPTVDAVPLSVIDDIKAEIRSRVFDIQATSDKYFDGVDDVMDIVDSVIDKHISGGEE